MNQIQKIAYLGSRALAASIWYDASDLPKRKRLLAKTLELIAGDKAQMMCQMEIDRETSNDKAD